MAISNCLKRIDTLRGGFEGIISIIRARIDLIVEGQNLTLLLKSVDKTTKSQVILQHTVEGLSIIVIAYYVAGLAGYIFKGLQEVGWLKQCESRLSPVCAACHRPRLCHHHSQISAQEVVARGAAGGRRQAAGIAE